MSQRDPSFRSPPVNEVALAVYFSPPLALRAVHTGLLWEAWWDRYPRAEDRPVLPPVQPEDFGPARPLLPIQFVGQPAGFRTWYLSPEGDRVVQLQSDRLVLNWRKLSDSHPYPRYETLRPEFEALLTNLLDFCEGQGLGTANMAQAEVSYTNPVPLEEVQGPAGPARLLAPWSGQYSDSFLPQAEDLGLTLRYRIPREGTEEPAGRLYVQAQRAWHAGTAGAAPRPVFLLQLFARGAPAGRDMGQVLEFLDLAHHWVVSGFVSLTTKAMHEAWVREETG